MLYCASYHQPENQHGQLISISLSTPPGVTVAGCLDIFKPSPDLLKWWKTSAKNDAAWTEYTSWFWALLAERKDSILSWIHSLGRRPEQDMTLLCWEKAGTYCHRNLVARLLQKHCPDLFGGCDVPQFQIGDCVKWTWAYGHLTFLEPYEIRAIEGSIAYLNWIATPVKLAELKKTCL